jgi:transposase
MRAANAVYSRSNIYLSTGDHLDVFLKDLHFQSNSFLGASYRLGRPMLALVTFFQYLEKLSDRQAAEATNTRLDWKYALHLSMNYLGLNPAALCDFRQSLLHQPDERQEFQRLLERLWEGSHGAEIDGQPIDAMRVLDEVCVRTRLEKVMASMRNVLQILATHYPEWLRRTSLPYWYSRYQDTNRQTDLTQSMEEQQALAEATGADIIYLLDAIRQSDNPELVALNEVQLLDQVWHEQFDPICLEGVKLYPQCYFCGSAQQKEGS